MSSLYRGPSFYRVATSRAVAGDAELFNMRHFDRTIGFNFLLVPLLAGGWWMVETPNFSTALLCLYLLAPATFLIFLKSNSLSVRTQLLVPWFVSLWSHSYGFSGPAGNFWERTTPVLGLLFLLNGFKEFFGERLKESPSQQSDAVQTFLVNQLSFLSWPFIISPSLLGFPGLVLIVIPLFFVATVWWLKFSVSLLRR